jgi:hypothetical protein
VPVAVLPSGATVETPRVAVVAVSLVGSVIETLVVSEDGVRSKPGSDALQV